MESFLIYIGKVAIGAGAFYLAFLLLFQNQKHFVFNRIYLPVSMLLSFIIPLFTFTIVKYIEASGFDTNSFTYLANTTTEIPEKRFVFEWYHYLFGLYLAGFTGFLFHLLVGHLKAIQILQKSQKQRLFETDVNITPKDVHPFSFFSKIVLSEKTLDSKNLEIIVGHESIHVKEKHTFDILFTEILFMFQWFNPFAWLIKDAVKNNLEYKTDHKIVQRLNPQNYQMAMVALADKKGVAPFLTALNGSQLKNRIIMMKRKTENKYTLLKQMVVLPLVAVLVMGLSAREVTTKIIEPENAQSEITGENWPNSIDEGFKNKIFRDGVFVLQDYGENAPLIFLNGKKVTEKIILNETDVKSVNVLIEESALERFGDDGKNGAMLFNTKKEFEWPDPVKNLIVNVNGENISLENPELKKYDTSKGFDSGKIIDEIRVVGYGQKKSGNNEPLKIKGDGSEGEPLYVVDGVEKDSISNLEPTDIERIDILKGESATSMYGEKAKNGVVLIQTKTTTPLNPDNKAAQNQKPDEIKVTGYGEDNLKNEQIKIRATGTGNKEKPLYIIDGKEYKSLEEANIEPEDIANISVLKDKSATAIYGEKAKEGVILINTKTKYNVNTETRKPLVVIDGMITNDNKIDDIDPETIASVNILKEKSATDKYGEKATDGAIEITLKKPGELTQNEMPVVLNGKLTKQKLNEFDRDLIEQIKKIDPEEATKKYGEYGKSGVLEITSRNVFTDKVKVKSTNEITSELGLRKFIAEKIKYPVEAQKKGQQGTVLLNLKIENKTWKVSQASGSLKNRIDLDEVVVVAYGNENTKETKSDKNLEYQYLVNEVHRIIQLSPKIDIPEFEGKTVSIAVKFMLQ